MADPILANLPEGQQALRNKYSGYGAGLSALPAPIVNSLGRLDLERVNRGQRPLSERETTLAVQAALTGQAVTPPPVRSVGDSLLATLNPFGGRNNPLINDLQTFGESIPRLPLAIAREFGQLSDVPDAIANAAKGDGSVVGNLAMAPGIRLIPGSYVLGNLLGGVSPEGQHGSPGELARHPLFTALDVLPYAGAAAGRTGVVKAAEAEAAATAEARSAATGGVLGQVRDVRPIPTWMTHRLDEAGRVVPNRLGNVTGGVRSTLEGTRAGGVLSEAFGREARDLSRLRATYDRGLQDSMNPEGSLHRAAAGAPDETLVNLARQARALEGKYADITPERRIEITRSLQTTPDEARALVGREGEFVNEVHGLTHSFENVGVAEGMLDRVGIGGKEEVFPTSDALKIKGRQREVRHTEDIGALRSVAAQGEASTIDPKLIADDLLSPLSRTDLSPKQALRAVEARARALFAQGYATDDIIQAIDKQRAGVRWDDVKSAVEKFDAAGRPKVSTVNVDEVATGLKGMARRDPAMAKLAEALQQRRWSDAAAHLRTINKRSTYNVIDDIVDPEALKLTIQRGRRNDNWITKTEGAFGEKAVTKAKKSLRNLEQRSVPARFQPAVEGVVRDNVKSFLTEKADSGEYAISPANLDEWFKMADEGNYKLIEGLTPQEYRAIQRDAAKTWQEMRATGFDPVFVHKVAPHRVNQIAFPHVLERITSPSQVRARTWDATPFVDDVTVGLSHQGMEWLARKGSERFVEDIINTWGRKADDVMMEYLPAARRVNELNPEISVREAMETLMKKEWEGFNPDSFITWPNNFMQYANDGYMLPKGVVNNMKRIHTPPAGRMTAAIDPVMGAFRTSILPLSPRWHVYNILGGGLMLLTETDPRVFMYARRAWNATKKGADDVGLPEAIGEGAGSAPRFTREWDAEAKVAAHSALDKRLAAMHNFAGGRTLRRLWESSQGGRDAFGNVVQKSYDLNGRFDDMYRAMGYLYDYEKGLKKGMSPEAAQQAGLRTVRKVMQDWDGITPIERSILRYVFPFYGWMQHIMRFTMNFPMDHPIRTSVAASFARNELADQGDGLPERFLNMFFVGPTDINGDTKAITLQGANPFSDVANYFTLEGFLGNVNPVVSGIAQSLGVDVQSGSAELYPQLEYDTETGRLRARSRNPLTTITQATIPQSRILFNLAGQNAEWKEVLRRNPEAAQRMFLSQIGIPSLYRDVRVNEERFKSELARNGDMRAAWNEALTTGDDSRARQYAPLIPLLDQVRALQSSGQLQGMQGQAPPSTLQSVLGALNPLG